MKSINSSFIKRQERIRYKLKKLNKGKLFRLTVFKSNTHIYAQIIDDAQSHTLVASSTLSKAFKGKKVNNITASAEVGKIIALEAVKKKITKVIFDKGAYPYHGKIKALADSAREHGLSF